MEKALPLCWKHKVKLITNMGSANPRPRPRSAWRSPASTA